MLGTCTTNISSHEIRRFVMTFHQKIVKTSRSSPISQKSKKKRARGLSGTSYPSFLKKRLSPNISGSLMMNSSLLCKERACPGHASHP